jgi:hypothetical protein
VDATWLIHTVPLATRSHRQRTVVYRTIERRFIAAAGQHVKAHVDRSSYGGRGPGKGDAVRGVEENLLQLARQIAAPYHARRCDQRMLVEADRNHVV